MLEIFNFLEKEEYYAVFIGHSCFALLPSVTLGGTQWRSWLRHCATSRKVAGSIPDVVTGILH